MCDLCVRAITHQAGAANRSPRSGAVRSRQCSPMARQRIDTVLAERGLAPSRAAAAASVRAGQVRVGRDGPRALKPSQLVTPDAELILEQGPRFVSRGGVKLENAIEALDVEIAGRDCLDVGASTGGFTDCLLQRGAARVIALDVAFGQLDQGLRNDPRVAVVERTNARSLQPEELPFRPDLATIDVSFISLGKVLPAVAACLAPGGEILALVKPQFELGRERVGNGGVVRSAADRRDALLEVAAAVDRLGLPLRGFSSSGLPGPKGNRESFIWCGGRGAGLENVEAAAREVEP
jgi:23S rRNA (cytidine1920-2'-O)/16S rRNA (cytidine1409-2'-O)-methyltransferase